MQFLTATNDVMPEDGKHYVTVFVGARVGGEKEPEVFLLFTLFFESSIQHHYIVNAND